MRLYFSLAVVLSAFLGLFARDPTLYEYYTSDGIKSGLEANSADHFTLNGKPYIIYAGTFHYFRHRPETWSHLLQQYRAAGLNTVQMYVPWNLHEDTPGQFDFESAHLNLGKLLEEIKAADMFAIVRPGPFICAEFEMGGFPSWLLRDPKMQFRSDYGPYLERVKLYWNKVMEVVNRHQFSVSGGPVLMLQLENEYGREIAQGNPHIIRYIRYLFNLTLESGYKQLIFTSDNIVNSKSNPIQHFFPQLLETANFGQNEDNLDKELTEMAKAQPNKPIYVSEYWVGWFDSWGTKQHMRTDAKKLVQVAENIILKHNGSVNFYPFIGGTNFGFLNGAVYDQGERITTSYDYDAPISEGHQYTEKYALVRQLYLKLVQMGRLPKLALPSVPKTQEIVAYGKVDVKVFLTLEQLLERCTKFVNVKKPVTMEQLEHGPGYGQRYGFVLYRAAGNKVKSYEVTGPIRDRGILLIDGNQAAVTLDAKNFSKQIDPLHLSNATSTHHIDMLVENLGRANYFTNANASKGIDSAILLDGIPYTSLTIYSLDFNQTFMSQVGKLKWTPLGSRINGTRPALYRTTLQIDSQPRDTFLLLDGWIKGSVFVNGFNVGRYWAVGPQKTLYIPAPLLKKGANTIEVFELHAPGRQLEFVDRPVWA